MSDIVRLVVKRFWSMIAIVLISLAVLVQLGRIASSSLGDYKTELAHYLSTTTGMTVELGELNGEWYGLLPAMNLRDLRLMDERGEEALVIARAEVRLDILSSLSLRRLVWGTIVLQNVNLGFAQNEQGRWWIKGMPQSTSTVDANLTIDDPFDIFLLGPRVQLLEANLDFSFYDGHQSNIRVPIISLENTDQFHRISAGLDVEGRKNAVSLIVEGLGDPRDKENFSSRMWLRFQDLPTGSALSAVSSFVGKSSAAEDIVVDHSNLPGKVNLELWAELSNKGRYTWSGYVDAEDIPLDLNREKPGLKHLSAEFEGQWTAKGQSQMTIGQVLINDAETIAPFDLQISRVEKDQPLQVLMNHIDNAAWLAFVKEQALLTGKAADILETLSPVGSLRNIELTLPLDDPGQWAFKANLDQVGTGAWKGAPAVTQVDGYVHADRSGGFVDLDSRTGFSMHYPKVYDKPLAYQQAMGQVRWDLQPDNNAIYVNSGLLEFSGEDGSAAAYFHVFAPWKKGTADSELVLQIGLQNSHIKYHEKYVPFTTPESLRKWLKSSLSEGRLQDGGFLYRGSLTKGAADKRTIQLYLDFDETELRYHPEWPGLSDIDGFLTVDDLDVDATVASASLYESHVEEAVVHASPNPDGKGFLLDVNAAVTGDASDGLRVLLESPIHNAIGTGLDSWALAGDMKIDLDLSVPLVAGDPGMRQKVVVDLSESQLSMNNLNIHASDIEGSLLYSDASGLQASDLSAQLWQRPIEVKISSPKQNGLIARTQVHIGGRLEVSDIARWTSLPELNFLVGESDFEVRVAVPSRAANQNYQALVTVDSTLEGTSLNLPQPYGKESTTPAPLHVSATVAPEKTLYDIHYNESARGLFLQKGATLVSAGVSLRGEPSLPKEGVFSLEGHIEKVDFGEWNDVFKRYDAFKTQALLDKKGNQEKKVNALKQIVNLAFEEFDYEGYSIAGLDLRGFRYAGGWSLTANSQMTAGNIRIYDDVSLPLEFDMAFLRLPTFDPQAGSESEAPLETDTPAGIEREQQAPPVDVLAGVDLSKFVALSFATEDFSIGSESYGSWSMLLQPDERGVAISDIRGNVRGIDVSGVKPEEGAMLYWYEEEGEHRTAFQGRLETKNLSDAMAAWKLPKVIESESARYDVDLKWAGSPANFHLPAIEGDLTMKVRKGRFNRAGDVGNNPLLRLMGLLNFDTLVRRLKLDFSDVVNSGMAYDKIDSKMHFEAGNLYLLEPLTVSTPSSKMQLAGTIHLDQETLDTTLIATLPVGNNIAFWAAFAAGLPAAAGVYVASKLFEKTIDQLSSLSYSIKGSWVDPELKFERMFDAKSAKKTGQSAASARDEARKDASEIDKREASKENQIQQDTPSNKTPVKEAPAKETPAKEVPDP